MKIKLQILNRWFGTLIFEYEAEGNTILKTLVAAIKAGADLRGANLRGADLRGADLTSADLRGADLTSANLRGADLRGADLTSADLTSADLRGADLTSADLRGADLTSADLTSADLTSANLRGANLTPIKNDFFAALLPVINEIPAFRLSVEEGRIDGSTYEGACACLNGTMCNIVNGGNEELRSKLIDMRDANRPIERFFLGIKKGDTPATSQHSALVIEWLNEFENYIAAAFTRFLNAE